MEGVGCQAVITILDMPQSAHGQSDAILPAAR